MWADPVKRANLLEGRRKALKSTEMRQRQSEAKRRWWADRPEQKINIGNKMREHWTDPVFREKVISKHPRGNTRARAKVKGVCVYCGGDATERDHDIPVSRGGTNDPSNIVLACTRCNTSKGRLTGDEFRADLERRQKLADEC